MVEFLALLVSVLAPIVGYIIVIALVIAVIIMAVALTFTGVIDCIVFSINRIKKAVKKCKSPTK